MEEDVCNCAQGEEAAPWEAVHRRRHFTQGNKTYNYSKRETFFKAVMSSKEKYISVLVHKTNRVKEQPDTTA